MTYEIIFKRHTFIGFESFLLLYIICLQATHTTFTVMEIKSSDIYIALHLFIQKMSSSSSSSSDETAEDVKESSTGIVSILTA